MAICIMFLIALVITILYWIIKSIVDKITNFLKYYGTESSFNRGEGRNYNRDAEYWDEYYNDNK